MGVFIRNPTQSERKLIDQLGVAIADRNVVRFTYNKKPRTVEPVVVGYVEGTENYLLRGWYTDAPVDASLGKPLHWRLFDIAKISDLVVLALGFTPRAGSQVNDEDMSKIIHQL